VKRFGLHYRVDSRVKPGYDGETSFFKREVRASLVWFLAA
jgi:hypothetical protein